MTEAMPNFEGLLREALAPVEPPADLVERLESTLTSITEMAADELEAWELSAMRDPRNWVRPAAADRRQRGRSRARAAARPPPSARLTRRSERAARRPSAPCATSARDAQAARRPLSRPGVLPAAAR
jgi:hypothetical protein